MDLRAGAVATAVAIATAAGGCATAPRDPGAPGPRADGRHVLQVTTHPETSPPSSFPGTLPRPNPFADYPTMEAECTATNDRGSWTITAPGRIEFLASTAPLEVTCRREGYRDASFRLRCIAPGVRTAGAAVWGLSMVVPPLAILGLPVLLGLGAATAGTAVAASDPDLGKCIYTEESTVHAIMTRLP